jgi:shikimate kinase
MEGNADEIRKALDAPLREEQVEAIEKNSVHVTKSLEFAKKKLVEYWKKGAQYNGMSYNAFLKAYNGIDEALQFFTKVDNNVKNKLEEKKAEMNAIPRRKKTVDTPPTPKRTT